MVNFFLWCMWCGVLQLLSVIFMHVSLHFAAADKRMLTAAVVALVVVISVVFAYFVLTILLIVKSRSKAKAIIQVAIRSADTVVGVIITTSAITPARKPQPQHSRRICTSLLSHLQ